jgi:hypothetical protein
MEGPDNLSKSFGLSIAFLIPGAVGLYAASFFAPVIRDWFSVPTDGTTVGGFLFVILGSAGVGVFISGIRWLVLESDYGLRAIGFNYAPQPPAGLDIARRKDQTCEAAYQDILFRHYQFYQFYTNMPVALLLAFLAWWTASPSVTIERALWLGVLMLLADVVLLLAGRHAIGRYAQKVNDLLGVRGATA